MLLPLVLAANSRVVLETSDEYVANHIEEVFSTDGKIILSSARREKDTATPIALVIEQDGEENPFNNKDAVLIFKTTPDHPSHPESTDLGYFPFTILLAISKNYNRIGNKHILMIDWNAFFPEIPLVLFHLPEHHKPTFSLYGSDITSFSMIIRFNSLSYKKRRELVMTERHSYNIQKFLSSSWFYSLGNHVLDVDIYCGIVNKGIFIETKEDCMLTKFEYYGNDNLMISYNDIILSCIMKRLAPNIVYIPFGPTEIMMSREASSFTTGGIFVSRLQRRRIRCVFTTPQSCLRINVLDHNKFTTESNTGVCGLKWETSPIEILCDNSNNILS